MLDMPRLIMDWKQVCIINSKLVALISCANLDDRGATEEVGKSGRSNARHFIPSISPVQYSILQPLHLFTGEHYTP